MSNLERGYLMSYFTYDVSSLDADRYEILQELMKNWENEIVEFKSATGSFSPEKLGQYVSAISNEANLKDQQYGWIILGVSEEDKKHIVGTNFKQGDKQLLERFKYWIAERTTDSLTFSEIWEVFPTDDSGKDKRVLMFKVPATAAGIPTAWQNKYFARAGDSLIQLSQSKIDTIRNQERKDWTRKLIPNSSIEWLDKDAIAIAREKYKEHMNRPHISEEVDLWSDEEFLSHLKLMSDGFVTIACMILLGKEEHDDVFETPPIIMWRLYGADGADRDYELFSIPFLTVTDKILGKLRNLTYRYMPNQQSLFTQETEQYDSWLLRELLNNCIAHSNYLLGGRIYVNEFDDHILITNPGDFLPGSVEAVLRPGYNPPFYRNQLLAKSMVNFNMIDTATSGIRKVFRIQKDKYFPMPDYEFTQGNQVNVTVYGKTLDDKYTHLLYNVKDLDLETVFLLDRVQKKLPITKDDCKRLKDSKLVEGRYPNIFVSYVVADAVGDSTTYYKNKGLDDEILEQFIIKALRQGPSKKADLFKSLEHAIPGITVEQKSNKLSNMLQKMKKDNVVDVEGKTNAAMWYLIQ